MSHSDQTNIEDAIEYRGTIALSDRPADVLGIVVNRTQRFVQITDINGSPLAQVWCPAVMAGARPEDLQ